jgi:hypothetical protein
MILKNRKLPSWYINCKADRLNRAYEIMNNKGIYKTKSMDGCSSTLSSFRCSRVLADTLNSSLS